MAFRSPVVAAADQRGRLYVVDSAGTRLLALARDGSLRWSRDWGDQSSIRGLSLDRDDRPYLVDVGVNAVVRLNPLGKVERTFASTAGNLLSFELFDGLGWMLVENGGILETYEVDLESGTLVPVQSLGPSDEMIVAAVGPRGVAAQVDSQGVVWTGVQGSWTKAPVTGIVRAAGLHWLADGSLLVLDRDGQCWYRSGPAGVERVSDRARGSWSPVPGINSGRLVLTDPLNHTVVPDDGPPRNSVPVGWAERLLFPLGLGLAALGWTGIALALGFLLRRRARRARDLQVLQVLVLIPLSALLILGVQGAVDTEAHREAEARVSALLERALGAVMDELATDPGSFDRLAAVGLGSRVFDYLRLLQPSPSGFRMVRAMPHPWAQGFSAPGLPQTLAELVPRQTRAVAYDGLWSRRRAWVGALEMGGQRVLVEVGITPTSALWPKKESGPWSWWPWTSLLAVGAIGVVGLARSAPRYALARDVLSPYPAPGVARFARGLGPAAGEGTVLAVVWRADPPRGRGSRWVPLVVPVVERCQEVGAVVAHVGADGVLVLCPGARTLAVGLAHRLARLGDRVVVTQGSWAVTEATLTDRVVPTAVGAVCDRAWTLAHRATHRGVLVADVPLDDFDEPVRGLDPEGPVAQVLDPSDPAHKLALDYLAPHREAFQAWTEGRFDDARRGLEFLAARMPSDPVVGELLTRVPR